MEWGLFDINSRLVVVPHGYEYKSAMPNGEVGFTWKGIHGTVGLNGLERNLLVDGMNEMGLSVNVFYHPGFAEYAKFDPARSATSISSLDVCQYLLTTCATVEQARQAISNVTVVGVLEPSIGIAPPIHLMVTESSGRASVIEFIKGEVKLHDAPLGVITNSPTYDWHITNLRNYLNLSPVALPDRKIEEMDFKPLGGGSGMIGLPGDFTPPSRFVRAVAFTQTARPTDTGKETMYEAFRILDNFNVPLGASEGDGDAVTKGMRSSTLWTTAYDTKNLVMHYHTMHNRRVRRVDLKDIDFAATNELVFVELDKNKSQDVEDVTPRN